MKPFTDITTRYKYNFPGVPKRIPLRIRFKVTGCDENGLPFENHAETVDISSGGGCMLFDKDVRKGENLKLYSPNGSSFLVDVCWFKYDISNNVRYVGFKLIEPTRGWVISDGAHRFSSPPSTGVNSQLGS